MQCTIIGVDVSKDHLDVHVRPVSARQRFANTPAGIAELLAWVRPHAAERIVFESTGPYQKPAVAALLAEGLANKQIARRLEISEKTVRNHVSHMYEKLQIYERSQAVLYAVRKGLVEL